MPAGTKHYGAGGEIEEFNSMKVRESKTTKGEADPQESQMVCEVETQSKIRNLTSIHRPHLVHCQSVSG